MTGSFMLHCCFDRLLHLKALYRGSLWAVIIILCCAFIFGIAPVRAQSNTGLVTSDRNFTIYSTKIAPPVMPDMERPGFLYELILEITKRVNQETPHLIVKPDIVLQPWKCYPCRPCVACGFERISG